MYKKNKIIYIKAEHLFSQTTPLDAQLKELENSLQTYFLYLSEASSIYSAKFSQLKSLQFDFIRHNLLSVLCDLDNGMPIVPPSLTTCLSRDSTTFLSQTIYILQCLHTDATVAMTWDRCHTNQRLLFPFSLFFMGFFKDLCMGFFLCFLKYPHLTYLFSRTT